MEARFDRGAALLDRVFPSGFARHFDFGVHFALEIVRQPVRVLRTVSGVTGRRVTRRAGTGISGALTLRARRCRAISVAFFDFANVGVNLVAMIGNGDDETEAIERRERSFIPRADIIDESFNVGVAQAVGRESESNRRVGTVEVVNEKVGFVDFVGEKRFRRDVLRFGEETFGRRFKIALLPIAQLVAVTVARFKGADAFVDDRFDELVQTDVVDFREIDARDGGKVVVKKRLERNDARNVRTFDSARNVLKSVRVLLTVRAVTGRGRRVIRRGLRERSDAGAEKASG